MIQHRIKEREPQYMDMKEIITEAARKLVLEKKVKKLTVKDIVEECQITRQAFYYHFEGIPDLIQWSIKQGTRRLLEACKEQGGAEAALKYLFVFAINAIPEVRKGIESNYGKELEQTLMQGTYELFESIVEEENLYRNYSRQELKLILRYHSHAIFGIFQDWTPEDTKNLDMIVANNLKEQGAGFETDTNIVTMITPDQIFELELMSKEEVAFHLLDKILELKNKM